MKLKTSDIEDCLQNHGRLRKIYIAARKNITEQLYGLDELEKTIYIPMRCTSDGNRKFYTSDKTGNTVKSNEAEKLSAERNFLTQQLKAYDDKIAMVNRVVNTFNSLAFIFPHHFDIINRLWIKREKVASARSEIGLGMTTINNMRMDFVRVITCIVNSDLTISDMSDIEKIRSAVNDDELISNMRR
ncbi:MAG: hypothetical protein NC393_09605 [Clostridium sp.]|nr:hypothetical protein [Clostridium sp.]MCM1207792.1 hypothetical protein [Ruminococcus sp.]